MVTVSLIIPTFNRVEMLARAIASVERCETRTEVIVIDDASTDGTNEYCNITPGIRYIRMKSNSGLARARNAGISASTGEFVAFLDDDDILLPGSISGRLGAILANPTAVFSYGPILIGDQNCAPTGRKFPQTLYEGDVYWKLLESNFIMVHAPLVRRESLLKAGLFRTDFPGVEDWALWLTLTETHHIVAIDEPVGIVREATKCSNQMTSNRLRMETMAARVIDFGLFRTNRARQAPYSNRLYLRKRFRSSAAHRLLYEAVGLASDRNGGPAVRLALGAIALDPCCFMQAWILELFGIAFRKPITLLRMLFLGLRA